MTAQEQQIGAWMTREVVTIDVSATLGQAARALASRMVSCVVVIEAGRPVGIVTERDIALCVAVPGEQSVDATPVVEVMGQPLVGVRPDDSLAETVRRALDTGIRHVPVIDAAGALVGIVTQSDLLRAHVEQAAAGG